MFAVHPRAISSRFEQVQVQDVIDIEEVSRKILEKEVDMVYSLKTSSLGTLADWRLTQAVSSPKLPETTCWLEFLTKEFERHLDSYHSTVEIWLEERRNKATVTIQKAYDKTATDYIHKFSRLPHSLDSLISERTAVNKVWIDRVLKDKEATDLNLSFRHSIQRYHMSTMFTRILKFATSRELLHREEQPKIEDHPQ